MNRIRRAPVRVASCLALAGIAAMVVAFGSNRWPAGSAQPAPSLTPAAASSPPSSASPSPSATASPREVELVRFVSPSGSDAAAGSLQQPWRTLQHAVDLAPGVVYAMDGTYDPFTVDRNGLAILAYKGASPIVHGSPGRSDTIRFDGVSGGSLIGFTVEGNATRYGAGVDIRDSLNIDLVNNVIRDNHSFGILIQGSRGVRVVNNDISGNDTGVEVEHGLDGTAIERNRIHDNVTAVDSSRGADGVNIYYTTGSTSVTGNEFVGNGTHIEYYESSNLTISGNSMVNGSVLESGTDPGGSCRNITFVWNVAYRTDFERFADGLILRCAASSLVANNTLSSLDMFGFDVIDGTKGVEFGGSIAGLKIENNIVVHGRAFSIDNRLPASVVIDYNLVWGTSGAEYGTWLAYVAARGNTKELAQFRQWTGYQKHGLVANPVFADGKFHLAATSPAIGRGNPIPGLLYSGPRPNIGAMDALVSGG
jgi:parallel beta-helix repeat protein